MTVENLHDAIGQLPGDLIAKVDEKRCRKAKIIPFKRYTAMAACLALILGCGLFLHLLLSPKGALEKITMMGTEQAAPAAAEQEAVETWAASEIAPMETYAADAAEVPAQTEGFRDYPTFSADEEAAAPEGGSSGSGTDMVTMAFSTDQIFTPTLPTTACYSSKSRITLIRSRAELEDYLTHYAYLYDFGPLTEHCASYDEVWFEASDLVLIALHSIPTDTPCSVTAIYDRGGTWDFCISSTLNYDADDYSSCHLAVGLEKNLISDAEDILLIFE